MNLCTNAVFNFEKFEESDKFIFQYVMTEFKEKVSNEFHTFVLNENFNSFKFKDALKKCRNKNLAAVKIIFKPKFYDLDVEDPVKMIMQNI